jgi:UDP-N-acetylglucosamine acyltransferase
MNLLVNMNDIHNTAIIGDNVELGMGNVILPNSIIYGPTIIGNNNIIGPNTVIGMPGQDTRSPRYDSSECKIKIGNNNIIREFTSIQKPCYNEITELGDDIYLMQGVHIPHDAIIESGVVITPMCVLAGITTVQKNANIGMGATVNQYCVIGQYSIVATGAAVMKNVKPFSRYIPNKPISVNTYAIEKFGFTEYLSEITAYVIENSRPESDVIRRIIDSFNSVHEKSKKGLYGV